jgi:hypothetical protein
MRAATVLLPAPAGPSIATTRGAVGLSVIGLVGSCPAYAHGNWLAFLERGQSPA